ncbi:C-GCAxxG-C-C family (seleno)protein [Mangrovibacterium lignilyticum]|uniref:C-GCAxxG-C-C family (seleno)protein n=1 Tax=Mangrovibacterium lignilyticum TaxID=2668052 RepID=UPI0021D3D8FA|nr:C-GCAxxG-C-C family (seleno)protein [Mangrovibacterium lignilyticum]
MKRSVIKKKENQEPHKEFWRTGSCTEAIFYLMNKEFKNNQYKTHEKAANPLTGYIYQREFPCGMLWGAALSIGTEALKEYDDEKKAISATIQASGKLFKTFEKQSKAINCWDIQSVKHQSKIGYGKYLLKRALLGDAHSTCFSLINKWTPDAIKEVKGNVKVNKDEVHSVTNCASEVVRRLGGSKEEMVMVAGFAGGIGLKGHACGAFSAAIWYKTLRLVKENEGVDQAKIKQPDIKGILRKFYMKTDSELSCNRICGKTFASIQEHAEYIENGGCAAIIETLTED